MSYEKNKLQMSPKVKHAGNLSFGHKFGGSFGCAGVIPMSYEGFKRCKGSGPGGRCVLCARSQILG